MTDPPYGRGPAPRRSVDRSSSVPSRVRAVLLAATLVGLSLALPGSAAVRICPPRPVSMTYELAGRNWLALRPTFPAGPQDVIAMASPAFAPDTIYATNGRVLMRTHDICTWTKVLDIVEWLSLTPGIDAPLRPPRIVALTAPSSASSSKTSSTHVYVAAEQVVPDGTDAGSPRPFVLSSANAGRTWLQGESWLEGENPPEPNPNALRRDPNKAANRLPAVGRIRELAASGLVPTAAYVVVEVPGAEDAPTTALYSTGDAGLTWQRRTPPQESLPVRDVVVSPVAAQNVYGVVVAGLDAGYGKASSTSGERFDEDFGPAVPISDLAVAVGGPSAVRFAVGHRGTKAAYLQGERGWRRIATPVVPEQVAVAPLREVIAATDGKRLAVAGTTLRARDVTPPKPFTDVRSPTFGAPTAKGTTLAGIAGGAVVRAILDLTTFRPTRVVTGVRVTPPVPPANFPAVLHPQRNTMSLPPGGTRDVVYTLFLPRSPTPIDVMFLVDSTESMQPVIDGLRQSMADIVNGLGQLGLEAHFGVGDFRDIPPSQGGDGDPGDEPYRLFRKIGPPDRELEEAIASIRAAGGNGSTSGLIAAHQAATGSGWRVDDGEGPEVVEPGLDAKFRPGTVRLAIIATDIDMRKTIDFPTIEATAKALRSRGIRAVGLSLEKRAREDLAALADKTGAHAPPGGLDCNGDGRGDLKEGDVLVCDVAFGVAGVSPTPLDLAPVIRELVERVSDYRQVRLTVQGDAARAKVVGGSAYPDLVNLKADNALSFTVRFSCPRSPEPSRYEFALSAGPAGARGASATATLECAAAPVRTKPPIPVIIIPTFDPPVAAPAPPGAPPPNPVPNANPNLNPNPGLNVNAGLADQREDQVQLALAENDEQAESDQLAEQSLAMSARREADPALLLGPAALLVASAGWVAGRRTGVRPAVSRGG